jgi:glycosyltransferase involved in cell wall biosynthesis
LDNERLHVIHNGVREDFLPVGCESQLKIRNLFAEGKDYFLFVGAIHPRKNVGRIIQAFEQYRDNSARVQKLVICGRFAWKSADIQHKMQHSRYSQDIIMLERVSSEDLTGLVGSAYALVYPSLLEGFGLPVLEGFRAETPVITSNISSMPEVAGDAAILVDPYTVESIAAAMRKLDDATIRADYISKGRERVKLFSWQKTAEKVYDVLRLAANMP